MPLSSNLYVEILTSYLMLSEDRALGRRLGHEDRTFISGIHVLSYARKLPLSLSPCEDMVRK